MSHCNAAGFAAECPFFKGVQYPSKNFVDLSCEGITPGAKILHQVFHGQKEFRMQYENYCCSQKHCYQKCEIYRAIVEAKYRDD